MDVWLGWVLFGCLVGLWILLLLLLLGGGLWIIIILILFFPYPFSSRNYSDGYNTNHPFTFTVLPPAQRDYLFGHKAHALQADEAYGTNNAAAHPLRHPHDPHRHDQAELASTSSHDKVNYEHKV